MISLRHLKRMFVEQKWVESSRELLSGRPEGAFGLEGALGRVVAVSALGMIRLDELSHSQHPLYARFKNVVLGAQERDGGWVDPMITALCVRALLCNQGQGRAVERGLEYLTTMQQSEGAWPREPLRRMPADAFATAWVVLQLGDQGAFRRAVRFGDAVQWLAENAASDPQAKRLWEYAAIRCRVPRSAPAELWSTIRAA